MPLPLRCSTQLIARLSSNVSQGRLQETISELHRVFNEPGRGAALRADLALLAAAHDMLRDYSFQLKARRLVLHLFAPAFHGAAAATAWDAALSAHDK